MLQHHRFEALRGMFFKALQRLRHAQSVSGLAAIRVAAVRDGLIFASGSIEPVRRSDGSMTLRPVGLARPAFVVRSGEPKNRVRGS